MKRIALVTGPSRMDDASFIYSAWSGLRQARERFEIKTSIIESECDEDIVEHLSHFARQEYDLVWAVGFNLEDALIKVSDRFPGIQFASIDIPFENIPDNVLSVEYREHEGAYLAGYAASRTSKTGRIGFLGGMDVPLIRKFLAGYAAGAEKGDSSIEIIVKFANSFISYAKGQRLADEFAEEGCDIVFHAAGAVGKGMIRRLKELDKLSIGVDIDQSFLAPTHVLTSMVKNVKETVTESIREFLAGKVTGGTRRDFGLAEGMIDLVPVGLAEAPEILDSEIEDLKKAIINGDLKIPEKRTIIV